MRPESCMAHEYVGLGRCVFILVCILWIILFHLPLSLFLSGWTCYFSCRYAKKHEILNEEQPATELPIMTERGDLTFHPSISSFFVWLPPIPPGRPNPPLFLPVLPLFHLTNLISPPPVLLLLLKDVSLLQEKCHHWMKFFLPLSDQWTSWFAQVKKLPNCFQNTWKSKKIEWKITEIFWSFFCDYLVTLAGDIGDRSSL